MAWHIPLLTMAQYIRARSKIAMPLKWEFVTTSLTDLNCY
jgi:hypothetical protein